METQAQQQPNTSSDAAASSQDTAKKAVQAQNPDAVQLQSLLKANNEKKRNHCAPDTFRCTRPTNEDKEYAHWGQIRMGGADQSAFSSRTSKFLHLSDTPTPFQGSRKDLSSYVSDVIDMMELHWDL